jgi:hypothetical protein
MGEPDIQDEVEVPETAQETVSTSTADAEEDAVLDRLLGISEETSVSTKIAETKPEVPVTTSQVTANPSREKAIAVLKRDGVPESVIASASDDLIAEWADKASKRQKDVDGYANKMKELEKKVAASSKTADEDDDVIIEDGEDAEPSLTDDDSSDSVNDEQTDDDEPKSKSKSIKSMESELAELRKSQQEFQQQSLLYQVEVADAAFRHLYGEKAPERDAIVNEMNRLGAAKPGSYQTMMQLAEEAYSNLAGPIKKQNARKATQPTAATKVSRVERPISQADTEDAILDAIMDGKSPRDARQSIRK